MNSRSKYKKVLFDILIQPRFLIRFFWQSVWVSLSQVFQNSVGSGLVSSWYSDPGSPPAQQIAKHFPGEFKSYEQSRQNTNLWGQGLDFLLLSWIQYFLIVFSLLAWLVYGRSLSSNTQYLLILFALGIIMHAVVTASLANVYDRLQSRVGWIWVLIGMIVICERFVKPSSRSESV